MLNIIIIVFILLGLIVHRYLSKFYEQGQLPYSMGFLLFANSFVLICFVSFIWMFGIIGGIVVALLCFFGLIYYAGLWVFLLPILIISSLKNRDNFEIPKVNPLVYGGFSFLVMFIASLTVVNFFVSPYKSMWEIIEEDVWTLALIFAGILIVSIVAHAAILYLLSKKLRVTDAQVRRGGLEGLILFGEWSKK